MIGRRCAVAAIAVTAAALAGSSVAAASTGDWEASSRSGALASFELNTAKVRVHGRVVRRLAVEDLVVQAPITCTNPFSTPLPVDVEVIAGTAVVSRAGAFTTGAISRRSGGTLVAGTFKRGKLKLTYRHVTRTRNAYEGGAEVCDTRTVHLSGSRSRRRTLKDGLWVGQTAEQEPVELNVVAGGRALTTPAGIGPTGVKDYAFEIAASSSADPCAYQISEPVFVAAGESFSNSATRLGDEAVLSGAFGSAGAVSGTFSNPEESCPAEAWSANWRFAPR